MTRQRIPNDVKFRVLVEAGYRCAVPTCRTILTLDLHHIIEVNKDSGNDPDNLICLCPNCHALYHRQKIPQEAIRIWKMILVSLNNAYDKEAIDYLLMLHIIENTDDKDFSLIVSGDGFLRFSALLNSGMINVTYIPRSRYGHDACYDLGLSEKGNSFVAAWKSGKLEGVKDALGYIGIEDANDITEESETGASTGSGETPRPKS